jgi:hypothetical protein
MLVQADEGKFTFVVARAVLRDLWHIYRGWKWSTDRRPWFHEQDRDIGDRHVGFLGVVAIVQSQAADGRYIFHSNGAKNLCKMVVSLSAVCVLALTVCKGISFNIYLLDNEQLVFHAAVKYRALDHVRGHFLRVEKGKTYVGPPF